MGRTAVAEDNVGGGRGQDPGSSGDRGPYEWRCRDESLPLGVALVFASAAKMTEARHSHWGQQVGSYVGYETANE